MQFKTSVKTTLLGALIIGTTLPAGAQTGTTGGTGTGTMQGGTGGTGTMQGGTGGTGTMQGGTGGTGTMQGGTGTMQNGTMMQGGMMGGTGTGGTLREMVDARMATSAQDRLFMVRAAEGNLAEITLAQLAMNKTKTPGVLSVARTIVQGHTRAQTELMAIMARNGMTMPPMLSPTHMAVQNTLQKARGANFDKMYMANQTDDHENTIALFQTQIMNGGDPELKAHASKYLPDIVGHTVMIYTVAKQVGAPGSELRPAMPPIPPGVTPTMMPMDGMTMPGMMPQTPNTTGAMGGNPMSGTGTMGGTMNGTGTPSTGVMGTTGGM